MKNLLILFTVGAILIMGSCKKSEDNPEQKSIYTNEYNVSSSGNGVVIDTINYKDKSGNKITLTDESNFSLSFETENAYDAYLYVSGSTSENDTCIYSLYVKDVNGGIVCGTESESSTTSQFHFTWYKECKYTTTK